jgi:solute carrier family 29 (equilibrative nucleoside transporter), member 1/2/3
LISKFTQSVFPPITTSIFSVNEDPSVFWTLPLVFHAIHFVIFNVADLLGRLITSYSPLLLSSPGVLLLLSLARFFFIPLFLLCNIGIQGRITPPAINSDAIYFLLVLLLGLTNGYTSCSAMVCASSLKLNPLLEGKCIYVDTAATVANFSLALGLVSGSIVSFAVKSVVCGGCNPFKG